MGKESLEKAKVAKNDEFYTRYEDIKEQIEQYYSFNSSVFRGKTIICPCDDYEKSNFTKYFIDNFKKFGLKKLISTCMCDTHGKCQTVSEHGHEEFWLDGTGDFRSKEIEKYIDEADFVITNPPFSLFRELLSPCVEKEKGFILVGNKNAITYRSMFTLIMQGKLWLGPPFKNGKAVFVVPEKPTNRGDDFYDEKTGTVSFHNIGWFTNVKYNNGKNSIKLNTMRYNLDNNTRLKKRLLKTYGKVEYPHYDNYDAIDVPFVDAIPSDYNGVMGVPITFLDKWNPEQFDIVMFRKGNDGKDLVFTRERERVQPYFRILIKKRIGKITLLGSGSLVGVTQRP